MERNYDADIVPYTYRCGRLHAELLVTYDGDCKIIVPKTQRVLLDDRNDSGVGLIIIVKYKVDNAGAIAHACRFPCD